MKTQAIKISFVMSEETALIGFETEQVYKVCIKGTQQRICNVYEDKEGNIRIGSVCNVQLQTLIEVLKFIKEKIGD
jgi:hypothetical protein